MHVPDTFQGTHARLVHCYDTDRAAATRHESQQRCPRRRKVVGRQWDNDNVFVVFLQLLLLLLLLLLLYGRADTAVCPIIRCKLDPIEAWNAGSSTNDKPSFQRCAKDFGRLQVVACGVVSWCLMP